MLLITALVAIGFVGSCYLAAIAASVIIPPEKPSYHDGYGRIVVILVAGVLGGFVGYLAASLATIRIDSRPPRL